MIQRGCCFGFTFKTLLFLITNRGQGQELQRNGPFELGVLGFINDAHAAFAELFEDFVVGYGFADQFSTLELPSYSITLRILCVVEPNKYPLSLGKPQTFIYHKNVEA